jgi:SNF2 family DNA or RNA helicase
VLLLLDESKPGRDVIKQYELFLEHPRETVPKVQVLLTDMETFAKEIELIRSIHWHFVIIDEAHRLKNLQAKIYGMMYSLQMEHILLMTGAPIQNNVEDNSSHLGSFHQWMAYGRNTATSKTRRTWRACRMR